MMNMNKLLGFQRSNLAHEALQGICFYGAMAGSLRENTKW